MNYRGALDAAITRPNASVEYASLSNTLLERFKLLKVSSHNSQAQVGAGALIPVVLSSSESSTGGQLCETVSFNLGGTAMQKLTCKTNSCHHRHHPAL